MPKQKPEQCQKLNDCHKLKRVIDQDIPDRLCASLIREACAECPDRPEGSTLDSKIIEAVEPLIKDG